ncbi:MAG: hypothetical protein JNM84_11150 [Planctomycetes bacterium]|nr:hypothetical protein [Planctomycetota bacterium]
MQLRFVRAKHGRYRLEVTRRDGTTTAREMAENLIAHDLAHLAWERHTGARESFFGQLEAGAGLEEVAILPYDERGSNEARVTEAIVGMLQTGVPRGASEGLLVERARALLACQSLPLPPTLTVENLRAVADAFRRLAGQFAALKVGEALEVELVLGER